MLTGTNLQYANNYNNRIVLESIRLHGPLSRISISRKTQLTAQTVTNITKKLMAAGLISETERIRDGRGAPSIMMEINPDAAFAIGLDFDRDHLTGALVDMGGKMRQRRNIELNFPPPEEAMDLMCKMIDELIAAEGIDKSLLWGVGVGFPGPMSILEGSVKTTAVNPKEFPGWDNVPVVKILEERIEIPVFLENNASAAAIGERWYGEGRHSGIFFYIFFGAGLGGGLVINGQLFPGFTGNSGEIGYIPTTNGSLIKDEKEKEIFNIPHLGVYFNLPKLYKELNNSGYEVNNPDDLETLFHECNEILMKWIKDGSEQLVIPLLSIEFIVDPDAIFFGGRLPNVIIDAILNILDKEIPKKRLLQNKEAPRFCKGSAGLDAAAMGLATIPFYSSLAPLPNTLLKSKEKSGKAFRNSGMEMMSRK